MLILVVGMISIGIYKEIESGDEGIVIGGLDLDAFDAQRRYTAAIKNLVKVEQQSFLPECMGRKEISGGIGILEAGLDKHAIGP